MAATELRIHLGAALRSLDRGEIVIEKGGIPVAVLSRYRHTPPSADRVEGAPPTLDDLLERLARRSPEEIEAAYERAVSKRAEPGAWERWLSDENREPPAFDAEEMKANMRKWREEGASDRWYEFTESGVIRHGRQYRPARGARRKAK